MNEQQRIKSNLSKRLYRDKFKNAGKLAGFLLKTFASQPKAHIYSNAMQAAGCIQPGQAREVLSLLVILGYLRKTQLNIKHRQFAPGSRLKPYLDKQNGALRSEKQLRDTMACFETNMDQIVKMGV